MSRKTLVLGLLAGLLWGAMALPALAATPAWRVSQLTTAPMQPYYVGVSGDRIVWQDIAPSVRKLWTWKMGSSPFMVLEQYMWYAPKVSGDRLAWIATGGSQPFRVYTWKAGDSTVTVVTSSTTGIPDDMQLSGDRLVWQVDYHSVVTWRVGDAHVTTLNVGPHQGAAARISGDRVVWCQSDGSRYQIATWKSGDALSSLVTNDLHSHDDPVVSGDRMAWLSETGDGDEWALYTKIASETVPTTVAVNPNAFPGTTVVSGDRLAWLQEPEGGGVNQVFTWRVGDTAPTQISAGTAVQTYMDLSDGRVVWIDGPRVMTWAEGAAAASVIATGTSPWGTSIDADRVAWIDGSHVMTAVLRSTTALTKPAVPSGTLRHGKKYSFASVLSPRIASLVAGTNTVLNLYHSETKTVIKKVHGKNTKVKVTYWHLRITVRMTGVGTGATVKLTAKTTLKYAGKWRAIAVYSGGRGFFGSTSAPKDFKLK